MRVPNVVTSSLSLLALILPIGPTAAEPIAFVGCPVVRDMNLPALPCWLAQDGDRLYFLGVQTDTIPPVVFSPPQLLHRVLIEGDLAADELVCGAPPIKNVKVSVLPEIDPSCNTILPQAGFIAPAPAKIPLPLRKGTRLATVPVTGSANQFIPARPPVAVPPYTARTFTIDYSFGADFLYLKDSRVLTEAAWFIEDTKARNIAIEAHRDRVRLTNGTVLEEDSAVAGRRAERVRNILVEWGVPPERISTVLAREAVPGTRTLTLTVQP
jgi:hypothetical protein